MDSLPYHFPKTEKAKTRWTDIMLPGGAWQSALYIASANYDPTDLPFLRPSVQIDLGFSDPQMDLGLALGLYQTVHKGQKSYKRVALGSNPASNILSTGIRHISEAGPFLEACPSWVPVIPHDEGRLKRLKERDPSAVLPKGESRAEIVAEIKSYGIDVWWKASNRYCMHRLFEGAYLYDTPKLKEGFRDGSVWTRDFNAKPGKSSTPDPAAGLKFETLVLEHYFECRFAGPLLLSLARRFPEDHTMEHAMILLDRIVNSPNNLTWTPASLNNLKKKFFDGAAFDDDLGWKALSRYMNQCAHGFRGLVGRLISTCISIDEYDPNSVILGMLKVLWQSPFCQGQWDALPRTRVGGKVQWSAYVQAKDPIIDEKIMFTITPSPSADHPTSIIKSWGVNGDKHPKLVRGPKGNPISLIKKEPRDEPKKKPLPQPPSKPDEEVIDVQIASETYIDDRDDPDLGDGYTVEDLEDEDE